MGPLAWGNMYIITQKYGIINSGGAYRIRTDDLFHAMEAR
jgi:hypothetical protein